MQALSPRLAAAVSLGLLIGGTAPAAALPPPSMLHASPVPAEEGPAEPADVSFGAPAQAERLGGLPSLGDRAAVLCWHSFLGNPEYPTDFSLEELGRQLDELLALGYRFVRLEDLLFGRVRGGMNIVVTLDDGHRTVPSACLKVFSKRGIVPALFVYPSVIGNVAQFMNPEQLRSLQDSGSLIAAHGYHHLYITDELYRQDRAAFEKEIFAAKDKVEALARLPVYVFGYPFGALSPITKAEVRRAGYTYAFSVKSGFVYADPRMNDPYELPRQVVTRANWPDILAFFARNAGRQGDHRGN